MIAAKSGSEHHNVTNTEVCAATVLIRSYMLKPWSSNIVSWRQCCVSGSQSTNTHSKRVGWWAWKWGWTSPMTCAVTRSEYYWVTLGCYIVGSETLENVYITPTLSRDLTTVLVLCRTRICRSHDQRMLHWTQKKEYTIVLNIHGSGFLASCTRKYKPQHWCDLRSIE